LNWLMFARILFTTLLLGSTVILQLSQAASPVAPAMLVLYGLILIIFLLSFIYAVMIRHSRQVLAAAYFQIGVDTFIVSMIILVTGNFYSIFSFLYLVVIIYSSMLLYTKGSVTMAVLCSIQYALLLGMEYHGLLKPLITTEGLMAAQVAWTQVVYKVMITTIGCFAVAFLSSLLAEQAMRTKEELWAMEDHVKRVEKLAAVGEMAAGLAHEIKNPLASLTGSIQILKDCVHLDADHTRLMQIVLREADRLSSLVNNFLLFARPPAGKARSVDLEKALTETVELFEKDVSCRGRVALSKALTGGLTVLMDPVHLRQVLWNLLINAAEAIGTDGTVNIRLFPVKGKKACIEIADNGCGMTPETIKSIFDPFFTTKPSGTGLGLSIVHSILESYDSRLDVASQQGVGTTFTLILKCVDPSS
jgi:two-component system sensor histidine kinase HydH